MKIGSAAVQGAIENAVFQAGDDFKILSRDPNVNVQTAATNIGLAGLVGGVFGGAVAALRHFGTLQRSEGLKALTAVTDRLGGIDGAAWRY